VKEAKVKEDVKQSFLAYLFFINSNYKKDSQLKKITANNQERAMQKCTPAVVMLL
jgi:hypothetical protein